MFIIKFIVVNFLEKSQIFWSFHNFLQSKKFFKEFADENSEEQYLSKTLFLQKNKKESQ